MQRSHPQLAFGRVVTDYTLAEMITKEVWEISRVHLDIWKAHIPCELGAAQDLQKELQSVSRETSLLPHKHTTKDVFYIP